MTEESLTAHARGDEDRLTCVFGLGFVGMTLAVALADGGRQVIGIEKNAAIVEALQDGRTLFEEPGMAEVLQPILKAGRLSAMEKMPANPLATVYIITVGTPIDENDKPRLDAIETAARDVANVLRPNDMVILRSTVRVGVTRNVVKPILDSAGVAYDLAFCPERTIEGKALRELASLPQLVGGLTKKATKRAARFFSRMTPAIVELSSVEAAELAKLANNVHRDVMFAFANEVAAAAAAHGLSGREVIDAANKDYPRGGICSPGPVGGPCLTKDTHILADGLTGLGMTPAVALAAREHHDRMPGEIADDIVKLAEARGVDSGKIALLGVAFKGRPATCDMRGTVAKPIVDALKQRLPGVELVTWDPVVAPADAEAELGVPAAAAPAEAVRGAAVAIIQNNHKVFASMNLDALATTMQSNGVIYDLWAQQRGAARLKNGVDYMCFGGSGGMARSVAAAMA